MSEAAALRDRRTGDAIEIPGDYQHRARTRGFVVQRFWHAEKERMIRKFSPPAPGEVVLDVGCGSGVIADVLAGMGARVTGVDGSPRAVDYARRTFVRPNLDFVLGLVDDLRFAPASVDRVYCLELIEHIHEHQARELLASLHRLTRSGGTLTLTTPNYHGLWPALELLLDASGLVPHLDGDQHVSHFHAARLRALLEETGWTVERLTTFSTLAPFASVLGWRVAEGVAAMEDRLRLPFGNVLFAVGRKA